MTADTTTRVDNAHTETWPQLAIGLYDKLTGRGAEIEYEFDNFDLYVPSGVGERATHAHWKMSGTIRIRTRDRRNGGAAGDGAGS